MADILSLTGETGRQTTMAVPGRRLVASSPRYISPRRTGKSAWTGGRVDISLRIDCTPTEARQMIGMPDLLPLYECLALALEDWLVAVVGTLDPMALETGAAAATGGCDGRRGRRAGR
jgi:hypothetical protein